MIVKDASFERVIKGLGGGGGWGRGRGVRTELWYSSKTSFLILVTNSQMFPLLLNMFMFFYKQNTLMDKNFRTYYYFLFFFIQKIFYNFYKKHVI